MEEPHVLVVEEKVDSLLFEFDLMGNLIKRYSMDNVGGPMLSKEIIDEGLDDTVQLNLTPVIESESPGYDVQDVHKISERNVELDAADTFYFIEQPNGHMMVGKQIEIDDHQLDDTLRLDLTLNEQENAENEDEHEKQTDEYAEFDPMDYLYIKNVSTEKSNEDLQENNLHKFCEPMNLNLPSAEWITPDLVVQSDSGTVETDIVLNTVNKLVSDVNSTKDSEHSLSLKMVDRNAEIEQEMRQVVVNNNDHSHNFENKTCEEDKIKLQPIVLLENISFNLVNKLSNDLASANNSDNSGFTNQGINHDCEDTRQQNGKYFDVENIIFNSVSSNLSTINNSDHSPVFQQEVNKESDRRIDTPKSLTEENNDFQNKTSHNKSSGNLMIVPKKDNILTSSTTSNLIKDEENIPQEYISVDKCTDSMSVSKLSNRAYNKNKGSKNKKPKERRMKMVITPVKEKVYNIRKRKTKKIIVSPDLGSDISSTSNSSDEESSSWSGSTIDVSSDSSSSDSVFEEPLRSVCTKYNLRSR